MQTPVHDTSAPDGVVWTNDALIDPHHDRDKPAKVRGMFAAIAGSYDLNNRLHSLWRDQAWRRFAVRAAAVNPGDRVLDCACGTGDLTELFSRTAASSVTGLDFTPQMLEVARARKAALASGAASKITYIEGDAMCLPFDDASFDVLSIAFGIRNVAEPRKALAEFARVLRPTGRLVILEFDRPAHQPMRLFNDFYCGRVMPFTATLISGDKSGAYKYLPRSVGSFMPRMDMEQALVQAGFAQVISTPLTMGICVCYRGVR